MTHLVFATGRLLELYMWNRWPFMIASDLVMVSYATRHIAKALTKAPNWLTIEKYRYTALQQNNMWSIAFEARTKEILKQVHGSNSPHWIIHSQTGTRFEHKSLRLHPILFNQQGTTQRSFNISTTLNLTQSIWNSLIPFRQTISIYSCSRECRTWGAESTSNAERVGRC